MARGMHVLARRRLAPGATVVLLRTRLRDTGTGANVKELVEDITSVLLIMAAGGLGFLIIGVALR
jgi:hypothetical protein